MDGGDDFFAIEDFAKLQPAASFTVCQDSTANVKKLTICAASLRAEVELEQYDREPLHSKEAFFLVIDVDT